ncbi:MAG: hypothetical protein LKM31_05035 [Sphingobium sp.]|nr:hypothetical protein [Sphingobium sp.]
MEVFGEAGLDCDFRTVLEHEAGDFVIAAGLFFGERQHRAAAALAGFDLELALGRRPTMRFCSRAAMPWAAAMLALSSASPASPGIGRSNRSKRDGGHCGGLDELVQRDRLDHGTHS